MHLIVKYDFHYVSGEGKIFNIYFLLKSLLKVPQNTLKIRKETGDKGLKKNIQRGN